ncbi:MAG: methyltransferase domain-containing protein [Kibdelosporangium sp.]
MTEPSYLSTTRASYDTVAVAYEELIRDAMDDMPFDRAMLAAFAELVPGGPVADLGCGPGRVTMHLNSLGLDAFGIDLSPGMIEVARQTHPGLRFEVGSMNALDLPDGQLAGVVSWYSIIHTPPQLQHELFAEFHRVLAPGGYLLLAFKAGDEVRHLAQGYGHDLSLDVYWMQLDHVAELAAKPGFTEVARLERAASVNEKGPQGYFLARRAG